MPEPTEAAYEEMQTRETWLQEQPEEKLLQELQDIQKAIAAEKENYKAMCEKRSLLSKLFESAPIMAKTPMGSTIDEYHGKEISIRKELERRKNLNPEKE